MSIESLQMRWKRFIDKPYMKWYTIEIFLLSLAYFIAPRLIESSSIPILSIALIIAVLHRGYDLIKKWNVDTRSGFR